jgi:hypothetical protein
MDKRICDALRGRRPRVFAEFFHDGEVEVIREGDAAKGRKDSGEN